jgi:hypothetical protein
MPPLPASVPIAFRLPAKEVPLRDALLEDTGIAQGQMFILAMRALAKERGIKVPRHK